MGGWNRADRAQGGLRAEVTPRQCFQAPRLSVWSEGIGTFLFSPNIAFCVHFQIVIQGGAKVGL